MADPRLGVYFMRLVKAFCERQIIGFNIDMPEMGLATVSVTHPDAQTRSYVANTLDEAIGIAIDSIAILGFCPMGSERGDD